MQMLVRPMTRNDMQTHCMTCQKCISTRGGPDLHHCSCSLKAPFATSELSKSSLSTTQVLPTNNFECFCCGLLQTSCQHLSTGGPLGGRGTAASSSKRLPHSGTTSDTEAAGKDWSPTLYCTSTLHTAYNTHRTIAICCKHPEGSCRSTFTKPKTH